MGARQMKIRQMPLDQIKPHPQNPRKSHDVEGIARSMATAVIQPVVIYEGDGYLVAGHGRLLAAQQLGLAKLPAYVLGEADVTPGQAAALRLADNRVAEGSTWDDGLLLAAIEGLMGEDEALATLAGFDGPDIAALRKSLADAVPPDDFAEVDENIEVEHLCPKCGYQWSGGKAVTVQADEGF